MEFVKSKNQYIEAILFDGDNNENNIVEFLMGKCLCEVQYLGTLESKFYPDGADIPTLAGFEPPIMKIACFYSIGKKKEIISIPQGHYLSYNGKAFKVAPSYDFEKEWEKVNDNESQYKMGTDEEV